MQAKLTQAITYIEWKTNRYWGLTGFLLIIALSIVNLMEFLTLKPIGTVGQRFTWHVLYPLMYGIQYSSPTTTGAYPLVSVVHVSPSLFSFDAFVALGLGVVLMTRDRRQGALWYAWTLPLPRASVFTIKWISGFVIVLAAMAVNTVFLVSGDLLTHAQVPMHEVWIWAEINTLLPLVTYAVGSVAGTLVGGGVSAFVLAIPALVFPLGAGNVLSQAFGPPDLGSSSPLQLLSPMAQLGAWIQYLSPFYYSTSTYNMSQSVTAHNVVRFVAYTGYTHTMGGMAALFALLLPALYWAGRQAYTRAAVERYTDLFLFRWLWIAAMVAVCLVISFVLMSLLATAATGIGYLLLSILIAAVLFMILAGISLKLTP